MPCLGFGRKNEEQQIPSNPITYTHITDKDELEEIEKIHSTLNLNEVFVIAGQSRLKPGGSKFTPNVVFAIDIIIIKDPSMPGLREDIVDIQYDMISRVRLGKGVFSSNIIFKAPGLINSSRI
jgi:hypothetical protein